MRKAKGSRENEREKTTSRKSNGLTGAIITERKKQSELHLISFLMRVLADTMPYLASNDHSYSYCSYTHYTVLYTKSCNDQLNGIRFLQKSKK